MRLNTRLQLFCILISSTVAGTLCAPAALRAQQTPTQKEAQAVYARYAAALKKKDVKAVGDLLTPGIVNKDKNGKFVRRAAMLQTMQQALSEITKVQTAGFKVDKAALQNNRMNADVTFHLTGIVADPQGKAHNLDVSAKSRDTWTKTGGKWLLSRTDDLTGDVMLLDGKPVANPAGK